LPRTPVAPWRRPRFARPRWVPWAWGVLAIAVAGILIGATLRFWSLHRHSAQQQSISRLLESSRRNETSGRLNEALNELDAAIELLEKAGPALRSQFDDQKKKRQSLARRDAEAVLDRLRHHDSSSFPSGEWITLIARTRRDPDLLVLKPQVEEQFYALLQRRIESDLAAARRLFESGQPVEAMALCDQIHGLMKHLPPDTAEAIRQQVEELVIRLVSVHGIIVDLPQGEFVLGSQSSYITSLVPVLVRALKGRGYLPNRASRTDPWSDLWSHAVY